MANKLTLTDIDNILDKHIETSIDFLMVVDHGLASYISEYLGETYDIIDDTNDLSPYTKEYYISMLFDDEEIQMFCETARANDGDYKYSDFFESYGDYYIFTDMDRETVDKTLVGNSSWSFCELVEDKDNSNDSQYDVSPECSNCDGCDEHCGRGNHDEEYIDKNYECEDNELEEQCECPICQAEQEVKELDCFCEECSEDYMKEFINECLEYVFNGCQECAIESVVKLAFKCKELGIESAKQDMIEFLEG